MAYVVPETQQPVPLYFANRDAFVLSLPALRQDLQSSRAIPYPLDETVYRARKSTRQFTAEALSAETINSLYEALPGWLTQQMAQEGSALPPASLAGLLAVCAAFRSPQRVAKISLSFRQQPLCGASVSRAPGGDGRICRGLLLLPSAGTASIPCRSVGEHTGPYLDLVVRWETITALYAERAFALAQIEVGHMLALLTEHLQSLGVAYYVKPADAVSPDEGALACRIHLGACAVTSPPQVSVDFSVMENEGAPMSLARQGDTIASTRPPCWPNHQTCTGCCSRLRCCCRSMALRTRVIIRPVAG